MKRQIYYWGMGKVSEQKERGMEGRYNSECGEGEWGKGEGMSSKGGKCFFFTLL